MRITKYGHSCLLLDEGGQKLLIDPGEYTFIEGTVAPEDIPPPDGVLFTHEHADHYAPKQTKAILNGRAVPVITNASLAEKAKADGFLAEALAPGETKTLGAFTIHGVAAAHADIPGGAPENIGVIVNGILYHPGDSFGGNVPYGSVKVMALPIDTPWGTRAQAFAHAKEVKPEIAIPIHDAYFKDFFLKGQNGHAEEFLGREGITVRVLAPGESLDL